MLRYGSNCYYSQVGLVRADYHINGAQIGLHTQAICVWGGYEDRIGAHADRETGYGQRRERHDTAQRLHARFKNCIKREFFLVEHQSQKTSCSLTIKPSPLPFSLEHILAGTSQSAVAMVQVGIKTTLVHLTGPRVQDAFPFLEPPLPPAFVHAAVDFLQVDGERKYVSSRGSDYV